MVIIESTVPPGTSEKIVYPIFEEKFDARGIDIKKFSLAHSYERVMPGENYMDSIINFWRVFAGINQLSADHCEAFLSQIINIKKFPLTRLKTMRASETAKLLENSYRAVNIAFIEEWGRFAEEVGVDLYEVIEAIRMRPTHSNIRQPGFGVGGYCLTKDPLFAKIAAKDIFHLKGHDFPFSTNAIAVNQRMPLVTLEKLKQYFGGTLSNKKLLLLGVSYRQDIDDTRFSPSEIFVNEAEKIGAIITAYDPFVEYWTEMDIQLPSELPDLLQYEAIVFAVPHNEFQNLSFKDLQPDHDLLIFDANNVLSKVQIKNILDNRIRFLSIGRG
jgi:nucleotide sugar dehydrogenase